MKSLVKTINQASRWKLLTDCAWWIRPTGIVLCLAIASSYFDPYIAYIASSWVIYGLLGLSLDLVWGRGGVLSLGQTALFGLGGYAAGIVAINFAPMTGNTLIWLIPTGAVIGALVAAGLGWFIFFSRMGPLPTTIVTYTFILILWTGARSFSIKIGSAVVGGDNGMSDIPSIIVAFGENAQSLEPNGMFVIVLLISALVYLLIQAVMRKPFGTIIDCVRLEPLKTELLGYDIRRYQWLLFVLSGGVAGIAGAMYGAWANYLNPSIFSVQEALLVPVYVLVGGLGTLVGAFIGAVAVGGLSFWLGGGAIGGQTTIILGGCLIFLVLFLKKGLLGVSFDIWQWLMSKVANNGQSDNLQQPANVNPELLEKLSLKNEEEHQGILESNLVTKKFGGVTAVNNVSQQFRPGKVHCLIGPNGAGKSTFLRCCTGTYKIDGGSISFAGKDITSWEPYARVQAGIGIKMQIAQIFDELDVKHNLWIAAYSRIKDSQMAYRTTEQILSLLGMKSRQHQLASELSHGEQQWLDIGMVLCLSPSLILLDEPAAGMTREEKHQLSQLIKTLAKTASVVVVDHDMEFVRTLKAEITVLHQGGVFAQGNIEDLRKDERILDIYLGRRKNVQNI